MIVYILMDLIPYEHNDILLITTNRDDLKEYLQEKKKVRTKWRYDDLAVIEINKEITTTAIDYKEVYEYDH